MTPTITLSPIEAMVRNHQEALLRNCGPGTLFWHSMTENEESITLHIQEHDMQLDPDVPLAIAKLNFDYKQYVDRYYDTGTLISLNAAYVRPGSTPEAKASIEAIWQWLEVVAAYYYTKRNERMTDPGAEYDFSQFDETRPDVELGDFFGAARLAGLSGRSPDHGALFDL
jgi:hypothetical protein